jgi:hypothetical protein
VLEGKHGSGALVSGQPIIAAQAADCGAVGAANFALNQRSTTGWKCLTMDDRVYAVRVNCGRVRLAGPSAPPPDVPGARNTLNGTLAGLPL